MSDRLPCFTRQQFPPIRAIGLLDHERTAARIIRHCASRFGVLERSMRGPRRTAELVEARHAAMVLVREGTNLSLNSIGRLFGRDHATVMNAVHRVGEIVSVDPQFRLLVDELRVELRKLGYWAVEMKPGEKP